MRKGDKKLKPNKTLPVVLHNLSDSVISEVEDAKKNEKLDIYQEIYFKHKISEFKYDKGITGFHTTSESITKERSRWKNEFEFEKKIETFKLFQDVVENIIKTYNVGESKAKSKVNNFVNKIANLSIDGINNEKVIEVVNLFISDLEENPILWQPVVWIDGIWMEIDSIDIRDNILLRKPEPNDLEFESHYENYSSPELRNWPSAILELEFREQYPRSVQNRINSIISVLRLFKLGSIENLRTQFNPHSIGGFLGGTISTINIMSDHYNYILTEEDSEHLIKFVTRIEPLIFSEILDKSDDEADYISIAYDRFCDALLKPIVSENILANAIMALEALYLKEMELSELNEKLSLRIAIALEPFGYQTLEVYNLVKKAYDIRSRFVHGSKVEPKKIGVLPEKILDYCRVSIIMFLQLHNEFDKEKIINLFGKSLLDDSEKKKFHKIIEEKCTI